MCIELFSRLTAEWSMPLVEDAKGFPPFRTHNFEPKHLLHMIMLPGHEELFLAAAVTEVHIMAGLTVSRFVALFQTTRCSSYSRMEIGHFPLELRLFCCGLSSDWGTFSNRCLSASNDVLVGKYGWNPW